MTLSEALKSYRRRHHLLQKQIAADLRISLKHYTGIENDHAHPSSKVMERICDFTGISVSYSLIARERQQRYRVRRRKKRLPVTINRSRIGGKAIA
jgi:transcriptional regulator with XRE-family HTH domain